MGIRLPEKGCRVTVVPATATAERIIAHFALPHLAAETGFGARISAARARWLACDGNVSRLIIGPEGQPLDIGRTTRVWPPRACAPWRRCARGWRTWHTTV